MKTFNSFKEFYPYYLNEHSNQTCRQLHFVGSTLVLVLMVLGFWTSKTGYFFMMPIAGYAFAWVGHFFFEQNKPATFKYPLYSLIGDWKMFFQMLNGKVKF
jgi:hypothetical protein